MKDAGLQGEGFTSQTHLVTVCFQNPALKQLNLFVKTETNSASHSAFLEETRLFGKEASFFMEYIPFAREVCKSKGKEDLLEIYPKCYYGDSKMLVLENIVLEKGYEVLKMADKQDFDTASIAFTTLAKHHALGFACITKAGGSDEFFKRFPQLQFEAYFTPIYKRMFEPMVENAIKTNLKILQKCDVEGKEEAMKLLQAKTGKVWSVVMEAIKNDEHEKILFLSHGDFWNNNVMFLRDKSTNKLKKSSLIDMQTVRYGSPALDISYYMYSSVQPEVRRQRLKDLLTIYLDVLNSTSQQLGHPTNISYDDLFQAYRRKLNFGLWYFGTLSVNSACSTVFKDFDIRTVPVNEWGYVLSRMMLEWVEANPDTNLKDAEQIVQLMMEYKILNID